MILSRTTKLLTRYKNSDDTSDDMFTIITSCYNKGKYLKDCINSIVRQDYRPISVVLIDDCSSDGSDKILLGLSKKLIRSNISHEILRNNSRLYCSSSYKIATCCAKGSYFGILDADDALVPDACSFVANLYKQNPDISYIWTQFNVCTPSMKIKYGGISKAPPPGQSLLDLGQAHAFSHWRTFSNRIDKNAIFCEGLKAAVDKYMGYRLEELGTGMFVDRVCYNYREGVGQAITVVSPTKLLWAKVRNKAKKRRLREGLSPFPIKEYKL